MLECRAPARRRTRFAPERRLSRFADPAIVARVPALFTFAALGNTRTVTCTRFAWSARSPRALIALATGGPGGSAPLPTPATISRSDLATRVQGARRSCFSARAGWRLARLRPAGWSAAGNPATAASAEPERPTRRTMAARTSKLRMDGVDSYPSVLLTWCRATSMAATRGGASAVRDGARDHPRRRPVAALDGERQEHRLDAPAGERPHVCEVLRDQHAMPEELVMHGPVEAGGPSGHRQVGGGEVHAHELRTLGHEPGRRVEAERGVVVVLGTAEALGPAAVEEHDVARPHDGRAAGQLRGADRPAWRALDAPHHAGAVQALQRNLVERGRTGNEMAGRIHVRAVVADHRHRGGVHRVPRHLVEALEARLRERGDPGERRSERVRQLQPGAGSRRDGRRREGRPPVPARLGHGAVSRLAGWTVNGATRARPGLSPRRASCRRRSRASARSRCDPHPARAPPPPGSRGHDTRPRTRPACPSRPRARARCPDLSPSTPARSPRRIGATGRTGRACARWRGSVRWRRSAPRACERDRARSDVPPAGPRPPPAAQPPRPGC